MGRWPRAIDSYFSSPVDSLTDIENGSVHIIRQMRGKIVSFFRENLLVVCLILAIISAIVTGYLLRLRKEQYTKREVMYASFLGSLYLRMLKCITIPMFTSCVILSLGELDMKTSGKLGISTLGYFYVTSLGSALIGLMFVMSIRPGDQYDSTAAKEPAEKSVPIDNLLDLFRNMIPPNIVEACVFMYKTTITSPENSTSEHQMSLELWEFTIQPTVAETNYLGLITLSVVIGLYLSYMGDRVRICLVFAEAINDITIAIIFWLIYFSPPAIFCLIVGEELAIQDWEKTLQSLTWYICTVILAQFCVAFIMHPFIYVCIVRKSPFRFMRNMISAVATAFATNSSIATIPVTLTCLEEKNMLNEFIIRFVVPLGATINTNCPAVYECVGSLFLAQKRNIKLSVEQYLAVVVVSTLASVGVAGIPQSAIITMMILLNIVQVPAEDVGLLLTIDWFLDRVSTACNVMIDALACGIFSHTSGNKARNILLLQSAQNVTQSKMQQSSKRL